MNRLIFTLIMMVTSNLAIAESPTITVSIHPLALAVEAIAGSDFKINTIIKANTDPHTAQVTPSEAAEIVKSAFVLSYHGIELNEKLHKIGVPYSEIGLTGSSHQWLALESQISALNEITTLLCEKNPSRCAAYKENNMALQSSIQSAINDCRSSVAALDTSAVLVVGTHPAWKTFIQSVGFSHVESLFTTRSEVVVPGTLSRIGEKVRKMKKVLFLADPDTQPGLKEIFTSDFHGTVRVLDENGSKAQTLGDFYRDICKETLDGTSAQ